MGHSYSHLSLFLTCEEKYRRIVINKEKPVGPESGAMHFGTAVHAGLQAILEGEDGIPVFNTYWEMMAEKDLQFGQINRDAYAELGPTFLERFKRLHAKRFKLVHPLEQRLHGKLGLWDAEGTPDFVGEFDDMPVILDFKTSRSPYDAFKIRHNPQMWLYALLAKQALKYEAKELVYMVFACKPEPRIQVIKVPYTDALAESHWHALESAATGVEVKKDVDVPHYRRNWNSCMGYGAPCKFFNECWGKPNGV